MIQNHELEYTEPNVFVKHVDHLIAHLSEENVLKYMKLINQIPLPIINKSESFLLLPITHHLINHCAKKQQIRSGTLIQLVNCMQLILSKCKLRQRKQYFILNRILILLIRSGKGQLIISDSIPEELKLSVINCKIALYRSLDADCVRDLYSGNNEESSQSIAMSVYFCLQLARYEELLELRLQSLTCVLVVSQLEENSDLNNLDEKMKRGTAKTLRKMLPGIVSNCLFICKCGSLLHHQLYVKALELCGKFVSCVMEDERDGVVVDVYTYCRQYISKTPRDIPKSDNFGTDSWYKDISEKLSLYLIPMMSLRSSSHWKIRYELVSVIETLLTKCFRNLGELCTRLIETAVALQNDENERVSKYAKEVMQRFLSNDLLRRDIMDSLEENFYTLLGRIDSAISFADDNVLLADLNLLNGYLTMIDLEFVLKSPAYLELLCNVLIHFSELDVSSLNSLHGSHVSEVNGEEDVIISGQKPVWLKMKHIFSDRTFNCLLHVCNIISVKADLMTLSQYFFEEFKKNSSRRKEIIFLMNNILFNASSDIIRGDLKIGKGILQMYLDSRFFDLPTTIPDNVQINSIKRETGLSLAVVHNNTLQVCLLIDGIGKMCACMGPSFRPLLFDCLYYILQKAGNQNSSVSDTATATLHTMTQCCNYKSVSDMFTNNVDYVTHYVIRNVKYIKDNQQLFDVLSVVINLCSEESLSTLCDIIEEIMWKSDDLLYNQCREGFLKVFKFFVRKLRLWFLPNIVKDNRGRINDSRETYSSVILEMDKYMRQFRTESGNNFDDQDATAKNYDLIDEIHREIFNYEAKNNVSENECKNASEDVTDDIDDNMDNEQGEKKFPRYIKLTEKICETVIHILPYKNVDTKVTVIEILMDCLLVLAKYENKLLPVVHKVWSPLVVTVAKNDLDPLVIRQSFELICIMAVTSKDFIRSRCLKELFPPLSKYLLQSASQSLLKERKSVYRMSRQYNLQLTLLQELGHFTIYLSLQEKEVQMVLESVVPYLSDKQPLPLQLACVELHKRIIHRYYCLVWIHLMSIWAPQRIIKIPERLKTRFDFEDISIELPLNTENEYKKNVSELLKIL